MSTNLPIVRDNRVRDRLAAVGQTVFTFDAPLFDAADLRVFVKTPASEYFIQRSAGFDVTPLADNLGATVTFALPPLAAGGASPVVVRLQGARVHNRLLDVTRGGIVRSQLIEGELDRQTLVLQELRRDVDATEGAAQGATTAAITATTAAASAVEKATIAVEAADRAETAAATVEGTVSYAVDQDLTTEEKARAQANLGLEGLQNALTPFGFTAAAGQTAFALGMSPLPSACIFSLNGAWLTGGGVDYTVAGSTLTLATPAEAGDRIAGVAIAPFTVANAMLSTANLADLANVAVARGNLGLGSAATLNAGTGANDVPKLDAAGKLPAVDGSQLSNLPSTLRRGSAVSLTGTGVEITGIPSTARRVTLAFKGVQKSGSDVVLLQLGTAAAIEVTGYRTITINAGSTNSVVSSPTITKGFALWGGDNTTIVSGLLTLINVENSDWVLVSSDGIVSTNYVSVAGGDKTLSGVLTRLRLATFNTDTFTAGRINVFWE